MKLKMIALYIVIVIVGIYSINTFIFPAPENSCRCRMGEEMYAVICQGMCPGEDCRITNWFQGYCDQGNCVTTHQVNCHDSQKVIYNDWSEPCWECSNW